jgi:photosystem II stability/assembly factor-like uncharacterized protein
LKHVKNFATIIFILLIELISGCSQNSTDTKKPSGKYVWKSVQIVGGGFVDGIIFHPTAKGVRYARTDMGGAYRWSEEENRWQPITDWVSYKDNNLMGIESIALDPSDPNKVYMACGTYTNNPNNAILRSSDKGKTFERTNVKIRFGGNESGRGNGERMAVDPSNGKIIYIGTRKQGLWRSMDQGVTWDSVASFPDITPVATKEKVQEWQTPNVGIIFVTFDPSTGEKGKGCSTIYAGVSLMNRNNIFMSTNAGKTWKPMPGQPTQLRPTHNALASDGMMYITYGDHSGIMPMKDGAVWKLNTKNGSWLNVTPEKPTKKLPFGYAAVSIDASAPQTLIVSTFYRSDLGSEEIFRSRDGGKTWKGIYASGAKYDYTKAPYVEKTGIHWLFDIEINPFNPDHAIFTTGYGGHETFNLTSLDKEKPDTIIWHAMATGIEETVALELLSPPSGAPLITAIGDYGGFVHWDLDKPVPEGNFDTPHFGNTDGVACAELKPETIVRVGQGSHQRGGGDIAYSLDAGKTWKAANKPLSKSKHGDIAVSSDGITWIWTPKSSWETKDTVFYTINNGGSWNMSQGISNGIRVIADRVNPKKFYGVDIFADKLFISSDGGATFKEQSLNLPDGKVKGERWGRGDNRGGQDRIYATPGKEGDLWLAAFHGLYHSVDEGKTFIKMDHVKEMYGFGFGKAAPGADYPALFFIGVSDSTHAFYRSDDAAKTWIRINDDQHQYGLVLHITGDPNKYGRVYVGTHGRGTLYGDISE